MCFYFGMPPASLRQLNDPSRVWIPGIIQSIATFLPPNEVAGTLRLVNKDTAKQLVEFKTLQLSRPSPRHAFSHRWGVPAAFRELDHISQVRLQCLTAASGSIENMEVVLMSSAGTFSPLAAGALLGTAAAAGQLEMCQWLRAHGCGWGNALSKASKAGHLRVCQWMLASGCPCDAAAVYAAERGGHEDMSAWLLEQRGEVDLCLKVDLVKLAEAAAEGFSLAVLQRRHGPIMQVPFGSMLYWDEHTGARIIAAAACSPTPDWHAKVEWLEKLFDLHHRPVEPCVAVAGRLNDDGDATSRLKWLHDRGYPLSERAAAEAAACGNLSALRYITQRGGPGSRSPGYLVASAALGRHTAVLEYLHTACGWEVGQGHRGIRGLVGVGALDGHVPLVLWAADALGVGLAGVGGELFDLAALGGSLEMMSWLRQRGCGWGHVAVSGTALFGSEAALEWLADQGCPFPEHDRQLNKLIPCIRNNSRIARGCWSLLYDSQTNGKPYVFAAKRCDPAIIRCLHRLGCPWSAQTLVDCIRNSLPVPMMHLMLELGCPVDWYEAAQAAATTGRDGEYRRELLTWLREEQQKQRLAQGLATAAAAAEAEAAAR
ncbi:hypothetical protein VOLCADRAFT_92810 [Volvox carteri f. nagariensis]|uniref:Ankyrin repeat domain-containing protein n=1 Tax=Volvox carteri f. nagariensis TaxID=3068 RepID=D8U0I8_VOLCA|nr:uncharacterized protein VOLCADRAFT_92810 [Volvox carteri f. nagariensis]EFJ46643.1 hypothetical protein VOLCADRAFT_92810 [Volvox carteri f. nagariensis]|eukprot:XP_002952172.1 hypothetical protein VOLCADRAFT_92810 [Volvox carteri f. nagariensis]